MKTILYALLVFLFVGCSDDVTTQSKSVEQKTQAKEEPKVVAKKAVEVERQEVKEEPKAEPEAKQEVKEAVVVAKADGAALYKACAACHGADASKAALNKSQVIKGWSAQKIADALNGYKDGTYGGAMKGLMKGQVIKLSEEEIQTLSNHIAKF